MAAAKEIIKTWNKGMYSLVLKNAMSSGWAPHILDHHKTVRWASFLDAGENAMRLGPACWRFGFGKRQRRCQVQLYHTFLEAPAERSHTLAVLGQRCGLDISFCHPDPIECLESAVTFGSRWVNGWGGLLVSSLLWLLPKDLATWATSGLHFTMQRQISLCHCMPDATYHQSDGHCVTGAVPCCYGQSWVDKMIPIFLEDDG
ncbi:hypothetical protein F5I97DRAFT_1826720 [Phlebopus sp. FC_14]|nr:hypothetical protein F5I97DRAFT_1826720 [Phlebopus sp. FC_14]